MNLYILILLCAPLAITPEKLPITSEAQLNLEDEIWEQAQQTKEKATEHRTMAAIWDNAFIAFLVVSMVGVAVIFSFAMLNPLGEGWKQIVLSTGFVLQIILLIMVHISYCSYKNHTRDEQICKSEAAEWDALVKQRPATFEETKRAVDTIYARYPDPVQPKADMMILVP